MENTYNINVSIDHIRAGTRAMCQHCPIAVAVKSQLKIPRVAVLDHYVEMSVKGKQYLYKHDAYDFIVDYDDEERVHPRSVTLTRINEQQRQELRAETGTR